MTAALRWAAMRAILMFHNCEGQSHKQEGVHRPQRLWLAAKVFVSSRSYPFHARCLPSRHSQSALPGVSLISYPEPLLEGFYALPLRGLQLWRVTSQFKSRNSFQKHQWGYIKHQWENLIMTNFTMFIRHGNKINKISKCIPKTKTRQQQKNKKQKKRQKKAYFNFFFFKSRNQRKQKQNKNRQQNK